MKALRSPGRPAWRWTAAACAAWAALCGAAALQAAQAAEAAPAVAAAHAAEAAEAADAAPLEPLRDAALLAALQGAWCNTHDGGRSCWAYDQFFADGTLRACGRHDDDPRPFDGHGRVSVSGDRMCYRVERASANFWLAPGASYCTRIVGIAADRHVYEDLDSGARHLLRRVPPQQVRCDDTAR